MNSVVLLDPRNKALFASFYVEGLRKMFGSKSLRYSMLPFGDLDRDNRCRATDNHQTIEDIATQHIANG